MSEPLRPPAVPPLDTPDEVNLHGLGTALWRGRWLIVAVVAVALAVGGAAAWLQPPVYESSALMRIVPEEKGFELGAASSSSMKLLLGLENTGDLQTSVGILESRRVAEAVMDSLALHVVLRTPSTPRDRVLTVLEAPRPIRKSVLDLRLGADGAYMASGSAVDGAPVRVAIGEEATVGDFRFLLHPELRATPPPRVRIEFRPYQKTVRRLQERLAVTQPASGSQLVRLRYRHADSLLVAAVPNIAAREFIEYKNRTASAESRSMLAFLQGQAAVYRDDLRSAETRLQGFLESARIIEPKTQAEEQAKRLATLQADRESLQTERESLTGLLRQIEASSRSMDGPSPYRQLIAFPSFLSNTMVQNILHSIIALENERASLLVRRMDNNLDVAGKTRRIAELETELHRVARNYLADLELRVGALDTTLGRFAGSVAALPAQEVELRRLARETELLEEVYQMIEIKLKEEEVRAAAQLANVQIVDIAEVPDEPEFPKPWMYLALSGILGLFAGSGAAVLRSRANPTVDTHADVLAATAGLPVLGAIEVPRRRREDRAVGAAGPVEAGNGNGRPVWIGSVWPSRRGAGARASHPAPLLSVAGFPDRLADSYRSLRTNVAAADGRGTGGVLLIAGVDTGDDGAVTAANLAITYAQQGTRTLLVDADLRGGSLHALFGTGREPGLPEALAAPERIDELVREIPVGSAGASLHLLACGASTRNPTDTVGSEAMRALLATLRERYDQVVVAAPAADSVPDAALLARIADRALLVVTAGSTRRPALETATRQFQHLRVPLEGVVLNGAA